MANDNGAAGGAAAGGAIGSVAGPVGTVIGAGIGAIGGYLSNKANNEANLRLAEKQNEWNVNLWREQSKYNDYSSQVQRMKAAGLNPALMFANGNDVSSASPAPQSASLANQLAYQGINPSLGSVIGQAGSLALERAKLNLEAKRVENETNRTQQEINESQQRVINMGAEFDNILANTDKTKAQTDEVRENIKVLGSKLLQNEAAIRNLDEDTIGKMIDNLYKDQLNDAELKRIAAETGVAYQQVANMRDSLLTAAKNRELMDTDIFLGNEKLYYMQMEEGTYKAELDTRKLDAQQRKDFHMRFGNLENGTKAAGLVLDQFNKGADLVVKGTQAYKNVVTAVPGDHTTNNYFNIDTKKSKK